MSGRYLGFFLGPAAGTESWWAPLQKFRERAQELREAAPPPSVVVLSWDRVVGSVLNYWAQVLPPPPLGKSEEMVLINRAFHAPPQTFTLPLLARLADVGVKAMRLVVPWSLAASLRWCLRTQPDSHAPFLAAVEDTIQYGASARGWRRNPWPRFWTYDSLAAWVAAVRGIRLLEDNKPNQKIAAGSRGGASLRGR